MVQKLVQNSSIVQGSNAPVHINYIPNRVSHTRLPVLQMTQMINIRFRNSQPNKR